MLKKQLSRVLYLTNRYNPANPDLGSSLDYELYNALRNQGFELNVVGPFADSVFWIERLLKRWSKTLLGKRYAKFPISKVWHISRELNKAVQFYKPEVVFTAYPCIMAFYREAIPFVCYVDTTFIGQQEQWPLYSKLGLAVSVWQERRVFAKAEQIITCSNWSKEIFVSSYHVPQNRVQVLPIAASLPAEVIPNDGVLKTKQLDLPIKLLVVGREYERKGVSLALTIVEKLNSKGYPAELVIVGLNSPSRAKLPFVNYTGIYKKSDPAQLQKYISWYEWAHFLIHPAKFEAAGIVPGEAAAFGVPTITNDAGGLATTVQHGVSGIVLRKDSPPEAYIEVILDLVQDPERYFALCESTRRRYKEELNWVIAGEKIATILQQAAVSTQQ